jgi:hypothetical protein
LEVAQYHQHVQDVPFSAGRANVGGNVEDPAKKRPVRLTVVEAALPMLSE